MRFRSLLLCGVSSLALGAALRCRDWLAGQVMDAGHRLKVAGGLVEPTTLAELMDRSATVLLGLLALHLRRYRELRGLGPVHAYRVS